MLRIWINLLFVCIAMWTARGMAIPQLAGRYTCVNQANQQTVDVTVVQRNNQLGFVTEGSFFTNGLPCLNSDVYNDEKDELSFHQTYVCNDESLSIILQLLQTETVTSMTTEVTVTKKSETSFSLLTKISGVMHGVVLSANEITIECSR